MILVLDFLLALFFALLSENATGTIQKQRFGFLALLTLCIASAFRYYNIDGFDYNIYEYWYNNVVTLQNIGSVNLIGLSYEKGYYYLMSFFRTIGLSFYGFCVVLSSFFYFCLWNGFKKFTNHYGLLTLVFAYKLLFYDTHISMRQPITIAGFFLIMHFIQEGKWVKYYIITILLTRFHNGAYLLLLLYPLKFFKVTKGRFILLNLLFLPTIMVGLLGIDVLGPIGTFLADNAQTEMMSTKADKYFDSENRGTISILYTLEYFLLAFLVYKNYDNLKLDQPKRQLILKLFLCLLPLFTLFRGSEILTREKDYFILTYAIIVGYILDSNVRKDNKKMIFAFVVLLCVYGYFRLLFGFNGDMLYREYRLWPLVEHCHFLL